MGQVVVGEVDALLISGDGQALPVTPDTDAPTSPRALLGAGIEEGDHVDTVRLFRVDEDGGLRLTTEHMQIQRSILDTLEAMYELLHQLCDVVAEISGE